MREIKFRRAYFTDEAFTQFSHFSMWGVYVGDATFIGPANNNFAESFIDQQFIGVKDVYGTDIYEGDLFNCIYASDGCTGHKFVVTYDERSARFYPKRIGGKCQQTGVVQDIWSVARYGIIGNIHQNPELLNNTLKANNSTETPQSTEVADIKL